MTIFIDLDGVIADLVTPWCEYLRRELGVDIAHETVNRYDLTQAVIEIEPRLCELRRGDVKKIVNRFLDTPGVFSMLEPYPLARETVLSMVDIGHDVRIASSPWKPWSAGEKIEWVRRRISTKIPVILLHDKNILSATGGILIDDCPKHVDPWGRRGWLMDRPWNQGPTAHRTTWEGVLRAFLA